GVEHRVLHELRLAPQRSGQGVRRYRIQRVDVVDLRAEQAGQLDHVRPGGGLVQADADAAVIDPAQVDARVQCLADHRVGVDAGDVQGVEEIAPHFHAGLAQCRGKD